MESYVLTYALAREAILVICIRVLYQHRSLLNVTNVEHIVAMSEDVQEDTPPCRHVESGMELIHFGLQEKTAG